ncbi:3-hydroxybutyrate oligomer hydrolase family protein [Streptomyces sp. NPDC046862]|uniref:3-hydroxybutyrate oligomer hydrolase family protein n=1 Tax=Streptomyces sp. NPDC046862 TaxID=3154603 RepID=UPI003456B13C
MPRRLPLLLACALAVTAAPIAPAPPAAAAAPSAQRPPSSQLPSYVTELKSVRYDGRTDDLLTGGLGFAGLRDTTPPGFADPDNPTPAELRRRALWSSAGLSAGDSGGLGRLYGANVDRGRPVPGDGKVAGTEYRAVADRGAGSVNFVVQVPDDFDRSRPCVVAAPASGLGGVYNMVGTAGAWALHRRCAVAYTDKGMGPAFDDLHSGTVMAYDGTTGPRADVGGRAAFDARIGDEERERFDAGRPYRVAYKMAHSGTDPQAGWGRDVLRSVELTLALLNRDHGRGAPAAGYTPATTTVLTTGISNGGGAAIAAGEDDRRGLVDAVVASEPQMNLAPLKGVEVREGSRLVPAAGLPLLQYASVASLLQPCAALTEPTAPGYGNLDQAAARRRCTALVGDDPRLITRRDAARVGEAGLPRLAQQALVRIGFPPQSSYLQVAHYDPQTPVSYAMSFARASVTDSLCGYGWARTDSSGRPVPYDRAELAAAFATSPGRAPAPGVLIDENSPGGPVADARSLGPDGAHEYNLRGERCVLRLAFPRANAPREEREWARRVAEGLDATRRTGDLHGKPTLIVHGRDDARVPVNHSSRPYLGLNSRAGNGHGTVSYVEVTHAHHADSTAPGYDNRYVPLGLYYQQSLDLMWQRLRDGTPLPPSQVVRTTPRGGEPGRAPALTAANVPPLAATPSAGDRIRVSGGTVGIPDRG